ncbi:Lrp/AsnC family transcriptional regulator [Polaribacter sp. MSW13]|uniref:Lrp/AsnC family transcriptional regulator n=1 Tax=Polaribacter marinus TaxID=2916838 RepID=A0A9X1VQK7_9FLAO|nr:Lrp/AsnC family transcriptional regulator [Polaribacter marinus]MCI2228880.1 Lrp/AsnC family transcriptional regulator [Polaribacter marinus]
MLDSTDKKLINLLQNDSKQTTKQLSLQLNLSVTAVYERIKKLEKEKVIQKYVALINKNKIGKSSLVFCHVKLIQHSREYVTTFEREILKLEEVSECFHVSGDYDYILKIYVKDMDEYRDFMVTKLTAIKYIGSTHSTFAIEEVKNTTIINL